MTTDTLDLSVAISTYNRSALLASCLEALAAQQVPEGTRWEILVVDNNSSDETPAVVERARAAAAVPIRYVFEPRQGVAYGRNTGVAQARARYVAFTDDDVQPPPDWVAGILRAFQEEGADALGGQVLPRWAAPVPAWVQQWLEERQYRHTHLGILVHGQREHILPETTFPPIWTANAAVRRDVYLAVGGFDTRMGRVKDKLYGGEDTDFIRRVVKGNFRVVFDPRLTVWHRIPAERMTHRYFRRLRFDDAEGEGLHIGVPTGRAFLGVRLYTYRRLGRNLRRWLGAVLRRRRDAFARELELQSALGQLWGELKAARRRNGGS